ncbi:MAG: hypothetical protein MUC90_06330 [Thermoplasmata archaeon]|nr:hypothetical protein [Thermoplasmata archaeon]
MTIKCTKCGTYNLDEETRCRLCGHTLHASESEVQKCPECGSVAHAPDADKCIACGRSFTTVIEASKQAGPQKAEECEHWSEKPAHAVRTAKVGIAGTFILLAGVLGIVHAVMSVLPGIGEDIIATYENVIPQGEFLDGLMQDYVFVAALIFVSGVLAIGMSMFAFMKSNFYGSIAGGIFGILAIGFLFGAFFGLVGLLLVATSKREFLAECG